MDEWLELANFADWATKLDALVDEAEAAAGLDADPGNDRRRAAANKLRDFRRFCPDSYRLDPIATKAMDGLVQAVMGDSLRVLVEAAAELDAYTKPLNAIVAESNTRAGWLSLRTPKAIAERLGSTIDSVGALYETTKDLDNAEDVKSKIDSVLRAVNRLQEEVQKATG